MVDAIYMLILGILGGSLGGVLVSGMIIARLWRRCTVLEWSVSDLQDRAATLKGRDMSLKRWTKSAQLDEEMANAMKAAPATPRRYDNDPLGS